MHNIHYSTYPEKVNKKSVQKEWDNVAAHEDYLEGATGLPGDIRWIDKTLDDYDEAMKYIEEKDSGWYDQLAVKYLEYPKNLKKTKKHETLETRLKEEMTKLNELQGKIHYADTKSTYVGCKKCGSRINTTYLRANYCPVCREDLRPESTLQRIEGYKEKIKDLQKQLKQEEKKLNEKNRKAATVMWLVKVEYHT